ncbi:hypothetical protein [Sphingobacterium deserti]|uniref:Uncharacterized protein n=1 Tax=Sphingobacterium deserti TaxID=1229276 RepID=A0A0B8T4G3_9SPHI|nr:hypothetical protein [Sphingobacterium deserti]KGE14628.1 hypothetical protein DI53_1657 [Sphingobacterium deserti]
MGQEFVKNLGSVRVAFDGKAPKEFKHTDEDLTISIQDVGMGYVYFNVRNNLDKAISFQWPSSYYVISEETIPVKDASGATAQMLGIEVKEANSVSPPTIIAPESKVVLKCATNSAVLFDYRKANKYFQENGKLPNDRAVLQFEINGAKVDKVIPIQVYTSKIKKALKK